MQVQFSLIVVMLLVVNFEEGFGETITQTYEGAMDLEISYPDSVFVDREFPLSVFIRNNGWEDKENIQINILADNPNIQALSENKITVEKLFEGGTYGKTLEFKVLKGTQPGKYFLNADYSHVLVKNNEEPQPPTNTNIAIPLSVEESPKVSVYAKTAQTVFSNAEFPFDIEIISEDVPVSEVSIQILPPEDFEFRGQTNHKFSIIESGKISFNIFKIMTPDQEIISEHKIPFQVIVTYIDDVGKQSTITENIEVTLRPRTFMELTTEGGIWIGDFFVAPYVSIGTIVGIPLGLIVALISRKIKKDKTKDESEGKPKKKTIKESSN